MGFIAFCLAGVLSVLASAIARSDDVALKERASGLAMQMREEMTKPAIMALEEGSAADTSLRGQRQRELAQPLMRKLLACGKAAEEPLGRLIDDSDASVRRSCVILLGPRSLFLDEGGKVIRSQAFIDLNIPLLEKALAAKDAQVRYFACGGLGDFATFSDECLERVRSSLPKLRELRSDQDQKVRAIAHSACVFILSGLAEKAKKPEDRKAAAEELRQLQQERDKGTGALKKSAPAAADDASVKAFVAHCTKHEIRLRHDRDGRWVVVEPKGDGYEVDVYMRTFPAGTTEKEMQDELKQINLAFMLHAPARLAMSVPGLRGADGGKKLPPLEQVPVAAKLQRLFKDYQPLKEKE